MSTLEQLIEDSARARGVDMAANDRLIMQNHKKISKSARARDYIESNPNASRHEVAGALQIYGVTMADVANAKAALKKKNNKKKAVRTKPATADAAVAKPDAKPAADPSIDATIQLDLLEAGVEFIRKTGGINEAQHILSVIRRIRSL
jgi:transposase